jgi:cytoskeletal protein RodZ
MPNNRNKRTKSRRGKTKRVFLLPGLLVLAIFIIVIGVGLLYYHYKHKPKTVVAAGSISASAPNTVNYSPGTASENAANNARKDSSPSANTTLNTPATPPPFSVTVSKANASGQTVTVAANVNGVTSGTCNFSISKTSGGTTFQTTPTEQVEPSNQSAYCPPQTFSSLTPNTTWYVSVSVTNSGSTVTAKWLGPAPQT